MDKQSSLLKLENIFMYFKLKNGDELQASHNVNLKIDNGEMVVVVGESGCGKSTVGKMSLGVLKPSCGTISLDGQDIWQKGFKWPAKLRAEVQVVHQDSFSSLNPVKTIFQTLSAPLLRHKLVKNKKEALVKINELLYSVDLTPVEYFIHKYPFQLSGGQRQRVSIIRATILKPKLIVADEPVSAVDASSRLSILDLMKGINKKHGIAFLYITHDLATARYFAPEGRIVVMYLGRVVETGKIKDCISEPAHPYLQALLTAIPHSDPQKAKEPIKIPLKSFDMPKATHPPSGCVFNPRCLYATDICTKEVPLLKEYRGRQIACHNKEDIPGFKK